MPWYFPWSDSIKKRACRYLLQHYVGQFLQEKLTLDQLSVDLFNGKGIVKDVPLDVFALNELLDAANIPLEILDGFIHAISVSVPWSSLLQENCELEVKGLEIVIGIKKHVDVASSVASESLIFSSMATSLQLAQECLKDDESPVEEQSTTQQPFEGLESFAQTIESVLSRIKVNFEDVLIRFEHLLLGKKSGVGLELHLERINYSDLSKDVTEGECISHDVSELPSLALKQLHIFGLKMSLDEFHESSRTLLRNSVLQDRRSPSPESVAPSPPLSPYQSALLTQSFMPNHATSVNLLPAVIILASAGEQEAKIKWKLKPSCPGPKIDFEYFMGTLNVLVSPKQLHLLLELMDSVNNLDSEDLYGYAHSQELVSKPMKADDFHKIEKKLQEQMSNQQKKQEIQPKIDLWNVYFDKDASGPLSFNSEKTYDSDTVEPESFYSLTGEDHDIQAISEQSDKGNSFGDSRGLVQRVSEAGIVPLNRFSDTKGDIAGSPLSKLTMPNPGLAGISGLDSGADSATKGLFRMSGLSITLLLKDPGHLHESQIGETTESKSKDNPFCKIADNFFNQISTAAFGSKDVDMLQKKFNDACTESHIRCFLATVNVSCELVHTYSCQSFTAEVTVGVVKVVECLVDSNKADTSKYQLTQLLQLSERNEQSLGRSYMARSPCLKAEYKRVQRNCSPASIQGRHSVIPKTELNILLGDLEVELDLSLIDRLHEVLRVSTDNPYSAHSHSSPQYTGVSNDLNQQALFSRTVNDGSWCDQRIQVQASCPNVSALLRFPVPDLRLPGFGDGKLWWKKNLRKEVCLLQCEDATFETILQDSESPSYEIRFRNLNGSLQLNEIDQPVQFLRVSKTHTDSEADSDGFDLPRIVVRQQPVSGPVLEEESCGDSSPDSLTDTCPILKSEPSPFSSKPVMYDKEELVVPGDPSEMNDFQEKASLSSKLHIELNLPEIDVNFHEQSFFELIYNRFGNDLLLWEPRDFSNVNKTLFEVSTSNMMRVDVAVRLAQAGFSQDNFQMCRSSMNNVDSYSSDEDEDNSDSSCQPKSLHTLQKIPKSTLSLTLNTSRTRMVMFANTKNDEQNALGKLLLNFDNAQLFYVLDYKGKVNLCYTSVQANSCCLHHALFVNNISSDMDTAFDLGTLYRTIYESESGVRVTGSKTNLGDVRPMLSLAVKSYLDTDRNSKEFVVALSLCDATLRHRMVDEGQMWLLQMIDFFCVSDEDILGYVPPVVVTMLHVHLWNCAVHYRPLYIPYQVLITAEGFSVCSNITADSNASVLRFIMDNAVLLISNSKEETMDLIKDYVAVADVDLFELSLRTVSDPEKSSPKLALTLTNNIIHIRTCSDSLSALLELLLYVASDGDLKRDTRHRLGDVLIDDHDEQCFDDCPVEQRNQENGSLHDLMSEAMVESERRYSDCLADASTKEVKLDSSHKFDVFHFPGESSVMTSEQNNCIAMSADHSSEDDENDCSDDEFCILDHPQKEQEVIYDEPKVKSFIEEIKIVPDHFSVPIGGVDQLKAPSNYPTPLYCYTVKEMSVIWHFYGGRDFQENKQQKKKQRTNLSPYDSGGNGATLPREDDVDEDPVVIDNHGNKKKRTSPPRTSWKTNAGVARDLNTLVELQLSKVRFQYEEYPDDTKQAWRQVLLIHDVEIRDRLSSSQINKLLYQYCTEARPKQTHANMVAIRILGLRPDFNVSSQEGCLKISLKPLRLNIDQDTLQFLINFCKDFSSTDDMDDEDACFENQHVGSHATPVIPDDPVQHRSPEPAAASSASSVPIFFRLFEFSPEVPIRLDYHGKHMDMGQRSLAGLLFAFGQLNCSEIKLRRLCQRSGLMGYDRVISYALNEWATDIKKTQIPGILGGVGPTYSFVQLVQGVKDLFWLPVEQYRRDGRIMRGLQRGASSFTTSSAMAFLELTNKLVQVVHGAAEVAYDMVSPETGNTAGRQISKRRVIYEPADFRQGVANAYNVVTEGFGKTACNIVQVAKEEHENKGMTGAVGGVLRHIPSAVVQPIILATEATSNVLGGVRNQILPDARREATEKWRLDQQ